MPMRLSRAFAACMLVTPILMSAESKNPADYPLRVHIFKRSETNFYRQHSMEEAKGEGRANLFANGDVHGVDFSFECSETLKDSFGFETYPAKWKKQGQDLVVLLPVFGKTGQFFTCDLKTDVKNFAYASVHGSLQEEPIADFKKWMVKHDYDPEHGKNIPTKSEPQADADSSPKKD